MAPPTVLENIVTDVATPSWSRGTVFWTAMRRGATIVGMAVATTVDSVAPRKIPTITPAVTNCLFRLVRSRNLGCTIPPSQERGSARNSL